MIFFVGSNKADGGIHRNFYQGKTYTCNGKQNFGHGKPANNGHQASKQQSQVPKPAA